MVLGVTGDGESALLSERDFVLPGLRQILVRLSYLCTTHTSKFGISFTEAD